MICLFCDVTDALNNNNTIKYLALTCVHHAFHNMNRWDDEKNLKLDLKVSNEFAEPTTAKR
jgi:hypothetical protein